MEAFGGTGYAGGAPWTKFKTQLLNPMGKEGIANVGRKAMSYFQKPTPIKSNVVPKDVLAELATEGVITPRNESIAKAYSTLENMKKAQDASLLSKIPGGAMTAIALPSIGAGLYTAKQPPEELGGEVTAEYDDNKAWWDNYLANLPSDYSVNPDRLKSAQGGRIGRQEGGLMDLGGRIGYADGLTVAEKGPLYIDPDTDLPLHNIEKKFQRMSKEERLNKYFDMLKRIESYKELVEVGARPYKEFLHWGPLGGDEIDGGGSGNTEMTKALEYTDHPAAEALYERGEHYNRGGRIGYAEGGIVNLLPKGAW
jgi:hypothetical protein